MGRSVFGIDFGTGNLKIYSGLTRTTTIERDIVAIKDKNQFLGMGDEAFEMYEKNPQNIKVVFPIRHGVIADLNSMKMLLEQLYKKLTGPRGSRIARFCITVPSDTTQVEKRAFYDLILRSDIRTREIKIVEKPIADAVGIGIDMTSSRGNMIVNIGADTTEISVVSFGGIVVSRIIKFGGNRLDQLILESVKKKYNIYIGQKTAEEIKFSLSDAMYDEDEDDEDDIKYVYGRNVITGLPSERGVSKDTVYEAILPFFKDITEAVKQLLERTPPELATDILDTGIYLTGGTALIKNLDKLIEKEAGLKVNLVDDPIESVVRGISMIVSDQRYRKLMYEPTEKSF